MEENPFESPAGAADDEALEPEEKIQLRLQREGCALTIGCLLIPLLPLLVIWWTW